MSEYFNKEIGLNVRKIRKVKLKLLNCGALNKVYTYIDPIDKKTYVFKQSINDVRPNNFVDVIFKCKKQILSSFASTSINSGIPKENKANFCSRSVASTVTDEMLNGENRILVKTQHIYLNNMSGISMELAKGKNPILKKEKIIPITDRKYIKLAQQNKFDEIAKNIKCHKTEIILNGTYLTYSKKSISYLDSENPITYEGLLRLQILDIINGECDRHPKNYLIDQMDGTVKGIDNECSFGIYSLPEGDVRNQEKILGILPNKGSLMLRMPPVVTRQIKKDVKLLYNNRDEYSRKLDLYLTKKEVEATIVRLTKLYEHLCSKNCKKVSSINKLLIIGKKLSDTTNSYWGRELYASKMNPTNWNHLREQK